MSLAASKLWTAEDLWHLPENGLRRELVSGVVQERTLPGGVHGAVAVALATLLRIWARQTGAGYVGVEAGFILGRDPDLVRGPDVSFVASSRIPNSGVPEAFWELAPDLAIEVISPSETADEVRTRVRDFLAAGSRLVWVVYPRTREVVVHLPDGGAQTIAGDQPLNAPDVLPEFACTVADLFD